MPADGFELEQPPPLPRLELRLLAQLALRGLERVLAVGVAQAGRQLDEAALGRVTVLTQAADPFLVVDGEDDDRPGMLEHPALERLAARRRRDGVRESARSAISQSPR